MINKVFNRKGTCQIKTEKGGKFKPVTLILAGDYLYYIDESTNNLYLILLSDAKMYESIEKSHSFEICSNNRSFWIAWKSRHDMDNWITAILEQIKHVKWKHNILDLDDKIQNLCNDGAKDESNNNTRKQYVTYLKSLDPQQGELLEEYIQMIHEYKMWYSKYAEFNKQIRDSEIEIDDSSTFSENKYLQDLSKQADLIIWKLFNSLKRAKFAVMNEGGEYVQHADRIIVCEEGEDDSQEEDKNDNNREENKAESRSKAPANKLYRKHYGRRIGLDSIDVSAVDFEFKFKVNMFREVPREWQVLILWPPKIFALIHEKYVKMNSKKAYEKNLFKTLEQNISLIIKENFYEEFLKDIIWNKRYNKVINDSNQYLIDNKDEEFNIFSMFQEEKKALEYFQNKNNQGQRRLAIKNSKSMSNLAVRKRRFISVSTSSNLLNPDMEVAIRHHLTERENGISNDVHLKRMYSEMVPSHNGEHQDLDFDNNSFASQKYAIKEVESEGDDSEEEIRT